MEVESVFVLAKKLRDEKEELYDTDTWRSLGLSGCLEAAKRKAFYCVAQMSNGSDDEKLREDLLDLINWSAFAYCLVENE